MLHIYSIDSGLKIEYADVRAVELTTRLGHATKDEVRTHIVCLRFVFIQKNCLAVKAAIRIRSKVFRSIQVDRSP
jgi:hypothetical protein